MILVVYRRPTGLRWTQWASKYVVLQDLPLTRCSFVAPMCFNSSCTVRTS